MSDRETPSTSWAVWAWQAYREGRLVEASALPAVPPAPDAAALREAALREAAAEADYFASKDLELHLTRPNGTPVQRLTPEQAMREIRNVAAHISRRILALLPKGGDGRRVYMGQIMAECDCPREAECQAAGRCIAEGCSSEPRL